MSDFRRKLLLLLKSITRSESLQGLQASRIESLTYDVDSVLEVIPISPPSLFLVVVGLSLDSPLSPLPLTLTYDSLQCVYTMGRIYSRIKYFGVSFPNPGCLHLCKSVHILPHNLAPGGREC